MNRSRRILILEDDAGRCAWFRRQLAAYNPDITCDVGEAIELLSEHEYSAILLDHDLRKEHYIPGAPDDGRTGRVVAEWLAQHPDRQQRAVILVHSLNYAGAAEMIEVLRDAGRDAEHIPFHYLEAGLRF